MSILNPSLAISSHTPQISWSGWPRHRSTNRIRSHVPRLSSRQSLLRNIPDLLLRLATNVRLQTTFYKSSRREHSHPTPIRHHSLPLPKRQCSRILHPLLLPSWISTPLCGTLYRRALCFQSLRHHKPNLQIQIHNTPRSAHPRNIFILRPSQFLHLQCRLAQ